MNFYKLTTKTGPHFCGEREVTPPHIFSDQEKLLHAHFHIWIYILSNYTLNTVNPSPYISCISGRPNFDSLPEVPRQAYIKLYFKTETIINKDTFLPFPTVVGRVPLASLRFVSCGKRLFHPLAFRKLLKIHDKIVWMFISLTVIFLPLTFRYDIISV